MINTMRFKIRCALVFLVGVAGLVITLAHAQERDIRSEVQSSVQSKWRILIVAESDDLGLRAGHPAYKRANNAIFTQLQRAGFDVLSLATDKTLPLCLVDVCKQQTEQDIVALANASSSDIDLLILFSVRYVERVGAGIIHREISVPSRMIDVKSGRRVGLWDDDGVLTEPIPKDCVDRCLQSALSDYARQIGRDSGLAIAIKLQEYQRWYDYHLAFLKFAQGELLSFEEYFQNSFKSNLVRVVENKVNKNSQHRVLLHRVVNRDIIIESLLSPLHFRQSLERILDDEGLRANIQTRGYELTMRREGLPYLWRYVFSIILFVVFLMGFYFIYERYQHNKVLARLVAMKQLLSEKLLNEQVLGERGLDTSTGDNPYPMLMKVETLLRCVRDSAKIRQQKNDVRVARDAFINALPVLTGRSIIKSEGLAATVNVLVGDNVQIGRYASGHEVDVEYDDDIAIGFTRLSHIGKQNKIKRSHDGFTLADEGSSNGSFLDGSLIDADQPVSLTRSEHSLCLGGSRMPLESGICQLRLYTQGASLVIEVDSDVVALVEPAMLNNNWPNLAHDQNQQWLLLEGALDIGIDGNGHIDIGCLRGSKVLAILSYLHKGDSQNESDLSCCSGYWLEPVIGGADKTTDISVNQTPVFTRVPLVHEAKVSIAGIVFSFVSVLSKKKR